MARSLYICYFGVREPLVQTQVIPYLRELQKGGHEISLLTFEPEGGDPAFGEVLRSQGIDWHSLRYHKSPSVPATLFDILNGARYVAGMQLKRKFDILHARAHIALLMARLGNIWANSKVIFDLRGLIADEYVDAGIWTQDSIVYRSIKRLEATGLKESEGVVVLTERLRRYLEENSLRRGKPTEVIPCCVRSFSGERFKSDNFELVYAGSVIGLYMLEEMGRFFVALKKVKPDAFFRILTKSSPEIVRTTFDRIGIHGQHYEVKSVNPDDVGSILQSARIAISFRKPTFSQIGASPTKIAEYLAAGLPIVMNAGVGDMDEIIRQTRTGVIIEDFSEAEITRAVDQIIELTSDKDIESRTRNAASERFDLKNVGGVRYVNLYERVLNRA